MATYLWHLLSGSRRIFKFIAEARPRVRSNSQIVHRILCSSCACECAPLVNGYYNQRHFQVNVMDLAQLKMMRKYYGKPPKTMLEN